MSLVQRALTAARIDDEKRQAQVTTTVIHTDPHAEKEIRKYLRKHLGLKRGEVGASLGAVTTRGEDVNYRSNGYAVVTLPKVPGKLVVYHQGRATWFTLSCERCETQIFESNLLKKGRGEQLAELGRAIKRYSKHECD